MRFLLVDEILELNPGVSVLAVRTFQPEEDFFLDHFPGFPVVPGVLLTEMMGQAAGKCLVADPNCKGVPMLAQIRSASFRQWVRPGEKILVRAEVKSLKDQFAIVTGSAEVAGRKTASCELMLSFAPRASFSTEFRDEVLERFLGRNP